MCPKYRLRSQFSRAVPVLKRGAFSVAVPGLPGAVGTPRRHGGLGSYGCADLLRAPPAPRAPESPRALVLKRGFMG